MQDKNIISQLNITAAVILSALSALAEYLFPVFMPLPVVRAAVLISFVFDVIFTALFVSDLSDAARRKEAGHYMLRGRGIPDLCGSVLVLFFFSAPSVIIMAAGTDSSAIHFMKCMTSLWSSLCVTGVLRVSRMTRLVSLPIFTGSVLTERHMTILCTIICGASAAIASFSGFVMRRAASGFPWYHVDGVTGFIAAAVLMAVLSAVIFVYLRYFGITVSSVLELLDRGFRRREFYLKIRVREENGDDAISSITSFYNESYLPAKMKQNINSPRPATYRVPGEDVKNFIRSR